MRGSPLYDEDVDLVGGLIAATVAGRIVERSAFGRSQVIVTFESGSAQRAVGHCVCPTLISPLPGWTRCGLVRVYEPYRYS